MTFVQPFRAQSSSIDQSKSSASNTFENAIVFFSNTSPSRPRERDARLFVVFYRSADARRPEMIRLATTLTLLSLTTTSIIDKTNRPDAIVSAQSGRSTSIGDLAILCFGGNAGLLYLTATSGMLRPRSAVATAPQGTRGRGDALRSPEAAEAGGREPKQIIVQQEQDTVVEVQRRAPWGPFALFARAQSIA